MSETITSEDLVIITEAKSKLQTITTQAEKAVSDAKIAELEFRCLVQQIFIKYGLQLTDTIDEKTGIITKQNQHPVPLDVLPVDDTPQIEASVDSEALVSAEEPSDDGKVA